MPIEPVLAREQPVERVHQVVVGTGADLHDDKPRRRVRHEDGQQTFVGIDIREECGACRRQVRDAAR